uniref:Sialin n=1 Tax=Amphiprion ocellaris TaxID=80972 RepID=A0AAQ5Z5M5_AMPOC
RLLRSRTVSQQDSNDPALTCTQRWSLLQGMIGPAAAPACCSARYMLAFLSSFGFFVVYSLRVNLSVAMVDMLNTTHQTSPNHSGSVCPPHTSSPPPKHNHTAGVYNWDSETQGWILGSFFYGYILTQIPGGYLAGRFGPKWLMGFGVLGTAVFTLLTPTAADLGASYLIAVRVLEGIGEGVTFPAMYTMWAAWAPPLERSRLLTITYIGAQLGTVVCLPLSGQICFYLDWTYVFYIFGAVGLVWFILWSFLVFNSPNTHPRISERERLYITNSNILAAPSVMKGLTCLNLFWLNFTVRYSFIVESTVTPRYLTSETNGLLSALPYLGCAIVAVLSGQVADYLRESCLYPTILVRKVFSIIGMIGPAAFLVAAGYTGCNYILAVSFVTVSSSLGGVSASGFNINHLDIAPSYAGILLGVTNTFATIPGMVGPVIARDLTKHNTIEEWQTVFYIAAAINLFGALFFNAFGKGTVQPWAVHTSYSHGD